MPAPRAVTFDAAGTLFTPAEPVGVTYARVAGRHGLHISAAGTGRAFLRALAAAPPLAFPGIPPPLRLRHERAWWHAVVRRVLGVEASRAQCDACFDELFTHYEHGAAWRPLPEAHATLEALRGRGLRVAVVSNFDTRLERVLGDLSLAPLVDRTIYSAAAGAAKPDPTIFRAAIDHLGVTPDTTWHVGDSLALDVAGARAAGLRAVLLARGARRPRLPPNVRAIRRLGELTPLIDASD